MNTTNCHWGYGDKYSMQPKNWPGHLRNCSAKLQGVSLLCGDFATVIEQAQDGAFLFIDPPYYNTDQAKLYTFSFTKADHHRLAELLQQHGRRLRFLLTYDDSPEIRGLYGWTETILAKQWNYTINRTDNQKKEPQRPQSEKGTRYMGREIFILNYLSTDFNHKLIRLTRRSAWAGETLILVGRFIIFCAVASALGHWFCL